MHLAPPTGRSSLIIDASTGIEPHFSSMNIKNLNIDNAETAENISIDGHILMVSELQKFTDESISKTINLRKGCGLNTIKAAYMQCYEKGLSGSTVYVDGSHVHQPIVLSPSCPETYA